MNYTDPTVLFLLAIGLLFTGVVAGILAGLLGVGGGIVIVPVLYLLFDKFNLPSSIIMHLAVGTSLATIIPTSISSARAHHAKGAIDFDVVKAWALFIIVGAGVGGFVARYISSSMLTSIFGFVALLVAINMVLPKRIVLAKSLPKQLFSRMGLASFIGLFSAWMGIGGGTLSVPLLTMFSYPVHRAVGTASVFGLFIAVPAVIGFIVAGWEVAERPVWSFGYVSIPAAILIVIASTLCAPFGSQLAHKLNPARLRLAFAIFLAISSARMLYKSFLG